MLSWEACSPNLSDLFLKILYLFFCYIHNGMDLLLSHAFIYSYFYIFLVLCTLFLLSPFGNITVVSEHNLGSACVLHPLCHLRRLLIERRRSTEEMKAKIHYQEGRSSQNFFFKLCRALMETSKK